MFIIATQFSDKTVYHAATTTVVDKLQNTYFQLSIAQKQKAPAHKSVSQKLKTVLNRFRTMVDS